MADYERIEREDDLKALADELMQEAVVAVDTEADSFYHYYDKTCLVQIGASRGLYLVDPLALGGPAELRPLAPMFASKRIRKVFHAAEYDLFVLKRDCGFEFNNLFDTMVSAQLLGYPAVGLAALVERHFDVTLPKDEQRSDWSARPLRETQMVYAAADVTYLARLAEKLEHELEQRDRLGWAREEFETLVKRQWPAREFDRAGYLRIKGAKGLDPTSLAVLRKLYLMRDARAREVDRPPFKVLGNRALIEIAQSQPQKSTELARIKGVTDLIMRRLGREILAAVAEGRKKPHEPLKRNGSGRRRMDRRTERRMARLKRWRSSRARELELDPGVLCPNSSLEAIAWANPMRAADVREVEGLKRWFVRVFGKEVAELLRSQDEATEK
ncbi:MAG: HRDC domain-containing protein [Myxococcota bacterium]|nr:HRDC domain-containing protein [Myxococcota bacterium]